MAAEAQLRLGQLETRSRRLRARDRAAAQRPGRGVAGRHDEVAASAAIELSAAIGLGQQHYDDADGWADVAAASVDRLPHPEPLLGLLYETRSGLRRQEGRGDEALADAQRALDLELRVLGPEHHRVALAYRALGQARYQKAQYRPALDAFERAAAIDEHALGADHPEMVPIWGGMANVYADLGDHVHAQSSTNAACASTSA